MVGYGTLLKVGYCPHCKANFCYLHTLRRRSGVAKGLFEGKAAYMLRVKHDLRTTIRHELDSSPGLVPCPTCNVYPPEMADSAHLQSAREAKHLAGNCAMWSSALAVIALIQFTREYFGLPIPNEGKLRAFHSPPIYCATASGIALLFAAICWFTRNRWAEARNPNRRSCASRARVAEQLSLAYEDRGRASELIRVLQAERLQSALREARGDRRGRLVALAVLSALVGVLGAVGVLCLLEGRLDPIERVALVALGLMAPFLVRELIRSWRTRIETPADLDEHVMFVDLTPDSLTTKLWSATILRSDFRSAHP